MRNVQISINHSKRNPEGISDWRFKLSDETIDGLARKAFDDELNHLLWGMEFSSDPDKAFDASWVAKKLMSISDALQLGYTFETIYIMMADERKTMHGCKKDVGRNGDGTRAKTRPNS